MHMPLTISVHHLQELIKKRLEETFPVSTPAIPSQEWICLQFSPSNPFTEKALRNTGCFSVKFGIQIRQLRKDHPDLQLRKCSSEVMLKIFLLSIATT